MDIRVTDLVSLVVVRVYWKTGVVSGFVDVNSRVIALVVFDPRLMAVAAFDPRTSDAEHRLTVSPIA